MNKNMMKTKVGMMFLAFLTAYGLSSCDFLDKEPNKAVPENYFRDASEVETARVGVYATLANSSFYGNTYMNLVAGDDLTYYGGGSNRISTTGLICNNATTGDGSTSGLWLALYNGIDRANFFLEQIDNVQDVDLTDALRARYKAEARFLRAFYYFNLVQHWGDVPFKLESTYSTGSVSGKDIARTDKNEIYAFIVKEMAEVADEETGGLPSARDLGFLPGYVSKSAAWGILARVYLFWAGEHFRDGEPAPAETQERFRLASEYGQKVMNNQGHALAENYWDVFIDMCSDQYNTTANESIWEVEFAGDYTGSVRSEGRIGNIFGPSGGDYSSDSEVTGSADPGYSYNFLQCTPKLYNLYGYNLKSPESEGNIRDERFIWNLMPFGYRGRIKDDEVSPKGTLGRTFTSEDLYKWVTGQIEGCATYQERSFDYDGEDEGTEFNGDKTQRGDVWRKVNTNPTYDTGCGKFRREYETVAKHPKNFTSINFPILRYADVLLMVAEAENEANGGPTDLARSCYNEVRRRAGVSQDAADYGSQQTFRNAIKDERARELCFEYLRRGDLIRWGDYVEAMHEQAASAQGGQANGWGSIGRTVAPEFFNVPESYQYFPIPEIELSVNKLITENNPGW